MEEDVYFEIAADGDFVRIVPEKYTTKESTIDYDLNWIKCKVYLKAGRFSGDFEAEFMTVDFVQFNKQIKLAYDNLKGPAVFHGLDHQLEIVIEGDGIGHFDAKVIAQESTDFTSAEVRFVIGFDQTYIKGYLNQLGQIVEKFPIIGSLK